MKPQPLVETVRIAVAEMVQPGETVVVAASGGPDSTALLHCLWRHSTDLGITLVAAHMEHGIRGDASVADAEYVGQLCSTLNLPLIVEHRNIPAIAAERHVSTSIVARYERHSFLRHVARSRCTGGRELIALGHTADDRAETILMNIIRGSGTGGLCAMPPTRLPIIRPMLNCTHEQAVEYCSAVCLNPRTDSTNSCMDYPRNRIRAELLPEIASRYNSGIRNSLLRLASIAEEDSAALDVYAARLLADATLESSSDEITISVDSLKAAPVAIQRRCVRQAISAVRGDLYDVGLDAIDSLLAATATPNVLELTLPTASLRELHVRTDGRVLRIWAPNPPAKQVSWQALLSVPGEVALPASNVSITAEVATALEAYDLTCRGSNVSNVDIGLIFRKEDLTDLLTVRSWRSGDKMQPKGFSGTKKLQDLYTDCKVPKSERHLIPVVTNSGPLNTIVAVVGVRANEYSLNAVELSELSRSEPNALLVRIQMRDAAAE